MMFKSIRSRLSLSFAAIALVAAAVLGVVLLAILQNYYSNQELAYLRGNATAIGGVITGMMSSNAPHEEVQSQIENLAFLSQTRIQIFDLQGQLAYDSGSPQTINVNLGVGKQILTKANDGLPGDMLRIITIGNSSSQPVPENGGTESLIPPVKDKFFTFRSVQAGGSTFGFFLNGEGITPGRERSSATVVQPMLNAQKGIKLGSVELSEGPAYGRDIVRSVAWGWAFASAVALLLAAAMGWYMSRRISAPVIALTDVTARMAQGDLSSRAGVGSRDEFGQLARSFNEMADQVETTVSTLRSFVSDAAHELRTPLTALRTNLDLALDENNTAERGVFVMRAQAMVRRLEELNTNLLDLSRLEANGHTAQRALVDLKELLQARSELYASEAEQARLSYEVDLPAASTLVRADASQLTRAMDNLVDNACKFTPPDGSIRVILAQEDRQAIFSVDDTGIGIPADDLPQLFNRFHRGRNSTAYPGSGLGLAIVKAIMAVHEGQVEVQSAGVGKGSRFSLLLPTVSARSL